MDKNQILKLADGVSSVANGMIKVLEIGKEIQHSDPFIAYRIASLGHIISDANSLLADLVKEKSNQSF